MINIEMDSMLLSFLLFGERIGGKIMVTTMKSYCFSSFFSLFTSHKITCRRRWWLFFDGPWRRHCKIRKSIYITKLRAHILDYLKFIRSRWVYLKRVAGNIVRSQVKTNKLRVGRRGGGWGEMWVDMAQLFLASHLIVREGVTSLLNHR